MDLIGCRHPRWAYDIDEASPSEEAEVDTVAHHEPSPRWKKLLTRLGIGLGGLVALYLLLMATSWTAVQPRVDLAFFEPCPGEHRPLVFAHQGGEGLGPENTQITFDESLEVSADVLDTDVHMTRDGVLVLIHDETVDRTSDGSGAVRDLTLSELRQLDFGYSFTTDDGTTFPYRSQRSGRREVMQVPQTMDEPEADVDRGAGVIQEPHDLEEH